MTICLCHGGMCELSIRCSWLDQRDHRGKQRNLQLGKPDQAIFGTQTFGSQTPPPPPPPHPPSLLMSACRGMIKPPNAPETSSTVLVGLDSALDVNNRPKRGHAAELRSGAAPRRMRMCWLVPSLTARTRMRCWPRKSVALPHSVAPHFPSSHSSSVWPTGLGRPKADGGAQESQRLRHILPRRYFGMGPPGGSGSAHGGVRGWFGKRKGRNLAAI